MTSTQTETTSASDEYLCQVICFVLIIPCPSFPPFLNQGSMTFSCSEPVSVAATFTDSNSFLQLPGPTSWPSGVVSVTLQFRTWNKAGLILTFALQNQEGSVFLYLNEARLRFQFSKNDRSLLELSAGTLIYSLSQSPEFTVLHLTWSLHAS